jgi:hypothetical protein
VKKSSFLACLLGLASALACNSQPDYKPQEFSPATILGSRLSYLDQSFKATQLCDDYRLFLQLRSSIHNDDNTASVGSECPRNYEDFVLKIRGAVASLDDLHTQVLFGNGLDAYNYPVITSCEGDAELCPDLLGAPVYPIRTNVETNFYAAIFGRKGKLHPFEIQTVNDKAVLGYRASMDADLLYSHTKANWSQNLMDYILKRPVLSTQDRSSLTFGARRLSLVPQKTLKVTSSFDVVQKVFPNVAAVSSLQTIAVGREYGCMEIFDKSSFDLGACRRGDGKVLVWLANWPQSDLFEDWQKSLADWLSALKLDTVYLDLRSNSGGSPLSPLTFLCRFGDDDSVAAIGKTQLSVRSWPRQFSIQGQIIRSESLEISDNLDLKRIDENFEVSDTGAAAFRNFQIGAFDRAELNEGSCKAMRVAGLKDTKWKILTDGAEFSAAEDFLLLARKSPKKFFVYGRPSVGGAGNPSWITLPQTRTGVRLSIARTLFDSQMVIEKSGLVPDVSLQEQETAAEIEARMLRFIDKGMLVKSDFIPRTVFETFFQ